MGCSWCPWDLQFTYWSTLVEWLCDDIIGTEAREFVKSIYKYFDEDGNVDASKKADFLAIIAEDDKILEVSYYTFDFSLTAVIQEEAKKKQEELEKQQAILQKAKVEQKIYFC